MFNWMKGRLAPLAVIMPLLVGANSFENGLVLQPQSRLWLSGTSTIRDFECAAGSFVLQVDATGASPVAAVLSGQKAVTGARFSIPASSLDCRNGTMNEHMLKALEADRHPQIQFELTTYDLAGSAAGLNVRLNGALTIGGSTRDVVIEGVATDRGNGVLGIAGAHRVTMSEYGLKRPSLMLGTIKVGDVIVVHFDLLLKA